jgi:hypothetical protein
MNNIALLGGPAHNHIVPANPSPRITVRIASYSVEGMMACRVPKSGQIVGVFADAIYEYDHCDDRNDLVVYRFVELIDVPS